MWKSTIFIFFERSMLIKTGFSLFEQIKKQTIKLWNIVKIKTLFSILLYFKIYECDAKLIFQHHYSSL